MVAIISLLIILSISLVITKIATVMLEQTGLSRELARFQARSAFTGVGFTTQESEKVVNHPVRRRVLQVLMLLGNVGVVSSISSLIISFVGNQSVERSTIKILIITGGTISLIFAARSKLVNRALRWLTLKFLGKYTSINVRDYAGLLNLQKGYSVASLEVDKDDWICNKSLRDLQLRQEGITVLGIHLPAGRYVGSPRADTRVEENASLVVYGKRKHILRLEKRKIGTQGDDEHNKQIHRQSDIEQKESTG